MIAFSWPRHTSLREWLAQGHVLIRAIAKQNGLPQYMDDDGARRVRTALESALQALGRPKPKRPRGKGRPNKIEIPRTVGRQTVDYRSSCWFSKVEVVQTADSHVVRANGNDIAEFEGTDSRSAADQFGRELLSLPKPTSAEVVTQIRMYATEQSAAQQSNLVGWCRLLADAVEAGNATQAGACALHALQDLDSIVNAFVMPLAELGLRVSTGNVRPSRKGEIMS